MSSRRYVHTVSSGKTKAVASRVWPRIHPAGWLFIYSNFHELNAENKTWDRLKRGVLNSFKILCSVTDRITYIFKVVLDDLAVWFPYNLMGLRQPNPLCSTSTMLKSMPGSTAIIVICCRALKDQLDFKCSHYKYVSLNNWEERLRQRSY